ncbi:putative holin-like toxin [Cohnella sp.]|uniref:putative holin-like toxin n=1 Tax=Cohnella sp. TaxID=1883426 RepID=UPI00356A16C1
MEIKDEISIIILFASLIIALLTYIGNNNKRKLKPTPRLKPQVGFCRLEPRRE